MINLARVRSYATLYSILLVASMCLHHLRACGKLGTFSPIPGAQDQKSSFLAWSSGDLHPPHSLEIWLFAILQMACTQKMSHNYYLLPHEKEMWEIPAGNSCNLCRWPLKCKFWMDYVCHLVYYSLLRTFTTSSLWSPLCLNVACFTWVIICQNRDLVVDPHQLTCASDSSVASNPKLSQTWQAGAKTKILVDLLLSPQSWAECIGLKWILHTPAVWSFLLPPKIDGTRWNRRNEKCRRRSFLVPLSLHYLRLQTE